jgi:hypothetical protein
MDTDERSTTVDLAVVAAIMRDVLQAPRFPISKKEASSPSEDMDTATKSPERLLQAP